MKPKAHYSDDFRIQRIPMLYQLCNRLYKSKPEDFAKLIKRTESCKCSDARDKIFALLSIIESQDARF
jgi:hypothetical protein